MNPIWTEQIKNDHADSYFPTAFVDFGQCLCYDSLPVIVHVCLRVSGHLVRLHVLFQVSSAQSPVPVISNVTSVHDLTKQVTKVFPWYLGNTFVYMAQYYINTQRKMGFCPTVNYTPVSWLLGSCRAHLLI